MVPTALTSTRPAPTAARPSTSAPISGRRRASSLARPPYNYADLNNPQRLTSTRAPATRSSRHPLRSFTTSAANANVTSNPAAIVKLGQTLTVLPRFEYRVGNLTLDGKFAGSNSISWYDPRGRRGSIRDAGGPNLTGITYTAQRASLRSADWQIVQTGGPDMNNGANFTNPTFTIDDGRYALTDLYSGEIIGALRTTKFLPIVWKAGVKRRYEIRDFRLDTESLRYSLNGAGTTGAWAGYKSPFDFDIGSTNTDASLKSISGGTVWVPDLVRMGTLFRRTRTTSRNRSPRRISTTPSSATAALTRRRSTPHFSWPPPASAR